MDVLTQNESLSGAGGVVTIGGRTLIIQQASPYDLAMFRKHLGAQVTTPLQLIAPMLVGLSPDLQAIAIQVAIKATAERTSVLSEEFVFEALLERKNAAFLVYLLTRKNHRDLTLEQVSNMIVEDEIPTLLESLVNASGLGAIAPKALGPIG